MGDLRLAFAFLTRLPVGDLGAGATVALSRVSAYFPVVGVVVGGLGGLTLWLGDWIGLPPILTAGLGLGVTVLLTGALHEDGLADSADGLGLTRDRSRMLEIMRDSRIGTYGVLALIFDVALRWTALAWLAAQSPARAAAAMAGAGALSRAYLPALMAWLPPARPDGLSRSAGRPSPVRAGVALVIGAVIAGLPLALPVALWGVLVSALLVAIFGRFVEARLGGQTGDVLGAAQQIAEIAFLCAVATALGAVE